MTKTERESKISFRNGAPFCLVTSISSRHPEAGIVGQQLRRLGRGQKLDSVLGHQRHGRSRVGVRVGDRARRQLHASSWTRHRFEVPVQAVSW